MSDSPTPDTITITDDWAVEKGKGAIFHWTTRLPIELRNNQVVIQGRRARVEFDIPAGVEALVEHLPLMDPRRQATDEQHSELIQFGWAHAETQPRLTLRQRGISGILRVEIKLSLNSQP